MELIKGNVKVELEYCGEGYGGDYDESNPNDERLMRFSVFGRENESADWEYIGDSSYCTLFPVSAPDEIKNHALHVIMATVYNKAAVGESIKKVCEQLSHIDETCVIQWEEKKK